MKADREIVAVKEVNLKVNQGEFLVILGPSGSGKTTFLMLLAGLLKPNSGKVLINGVDVTTLSIDQAALFRRRNIGLIFQRFILIPFLNSLENIAVPLYPSEIGDEELRKRATSLLQRVGLGHRVDHRPCQLSGGEQQRLAIARALVNDPPLVLADEPTSELDSATGRSIIELMKELSKEKKKTFIVATHDEGIVGIADRILKMKDGTLADEQG